MGLFGRSAKVVALEKEIELKRLQTRFAEVQSQNLIRLNQFTRNVAIYPEYNTQQIADRYCTTDDIYSIIRKLAHASAQISIYPYFEKNEVAAKQLKRFPTNGKTYQQKALQLKALVDLPETDPVYDLLENPSDLHSKYEFYEALYSMLYLHGEVIIFKERGEVLSKPRKLHILYSQHVVLRVSQTWPQTIVSYDYIVDGQKIMENIPPEDIIHIKYFNPNFSITGNELRGLSPLRVLLNRLAETDSHLNVTVAQLQNGGVPGIVFDKGMQADKEAIELMGLHKDNFYKYLSKPGNKGAPYFTAGELGYLPMGLKLVDMEVMALGKINFKKLCNAYSVSDRLFNNDATGSEVSDNNARKALYTDAALPNVHRIAAAFEMSLNKDFTDKKRVIYADASEIPELQEDMKELAGWLNTAWWVPRNQALELMKFERVENPLFDEPLIPTGMQTPEDMVMVADLPNHAGDYVNTETIPA